MKPASCAIPARAIARSTASSTTAQLRSSEFLPGVSAFGAGPAPPARWPVPRRWAERPGATRRHRRPRPRRSRPCRPARGSPNSRAVGSGLAVGRPPRQFEAPAGLLVEVAGRKRWEKVTRKPSIDSNAMLKSRAGHWRWPAGASVGPIEAQPAPSGQGDAQHQPARPGTAGNRAGRACPRPRCAGTVTLHRHPLGQRRLIEAVRACRCFRTAGPGLAGHHRIRSLKPPPGPARAGPASWPAFANSWSAPWSAHGELMGALRERDRIDMPA